MTDEATHTAIAVRNKQTVRDFFAALEREDIDGLIGMFAKDGRQHNPYHSGLFPAGAAGRDELRAYWQPVPANFDGMRFPIDEILATEDPSVVFVRFRGKIDLKGGTGRYENDYYALFRFDSDGAITDYVEIFNPIVAARGFGMIDQIK